MFFVLFILNSIHGFKVPGGCEIGHFYEPSLMNCLTCLANASQVASTDGFGCSCTELSIPVDISQCKPCNKTEIISSDGFSCVPRRCQSSAGRIVCRKCPLDYISVTQNFDGSPMKEVQCVKCARGYKASNNRCIKCESCTCNKFELIVRGKCIPKKYVLERPKYSENILHPNEVLEAIKLEYLCTKHDRRACRSLASLCVRNHYTSHSAGPCRLWLQRNLISFKGFPLLTIDDLKSNKIELSLSGGMNSLEILLSIHTSSGGFSILQNPIKKHYDCLPPFEIKIGSDIIRDCVRNVSELLPSYFGDIFELYLVSNEDLKPLPIVVQKPNGYYVEKGAWNSNKFRKFFLINKFLSITTNTTTTIYLRSLVLRVRIERDSSSFLKLTLRTEVQYASKSPLSDSITTSLRVEHEMPDAGVLRTLEISGGVLVVVTFIYAVIQTRGAVRRGGHFIALVPLLSSCIADALYFATCISTLHALFAEAGTLGLTLPLSRDEEQLINAVLYIVVTLKFMKVLWINWKQCRCDITFIDWSVYAYDPSVTAPPVIQHNWKMDILSTEWINMQTKRRVAPSYTVTVTLLVLYFISPWETYLPRSRGYRWVTAASVWWMSYSFLSCVFILTQKLVQPHTGRLSKLCMDLEISLIVFQEDYYAHYVNGRNYDLYTRSISHSLASCRLVCSPQLRNVFVKIQTSNDFGETTTKQALLSRFLGAFFERVLDGLNWIASERTILERLLDVEITEREDGNTSVLLYDSNITTPSCYAVTWMGEEWTLATFDAMLFGSVLIMSDHYLLAALVTIIVWKVMKSARMFISYWRLKIKM